MSADWVQQVGEAHTPNEMRAELARLAREDSLVRAAFNHAEYIGLSGEDKYLLLAYNAMKHRNQLMRQLYAWTMKNPMPSLFVDLRVNDEN